MNPMFESYALAIQVVSHLPNTLSITLTKEKKIVTDEKPKIIPAKKYYAYALTKLFLRDVSFFELKNEFSFELEGSEEEKQILENAKSVSSQLKFLFPDEV